MFFGDSSSDLKITVAMIIASLIIASIFYLKTKKSLLSLFIFSVLSNISFFLTILTDSMMFRFYNINWLKSFSLNIWPLINLVLFVILIIKAIKNKNAKKIN